MRAIRFGMRIQHLAQIAAHWSAPRRASACQARCAATATGAADGLGSDDGIKIWINKKLAFAHEISRHPVPGQDTMRASLSPGWNELLVKVDNTGGEWGFYLELREPGTNKPLQGVEFRTTPP